ncbi:MAG: Holliday junction resolvase RuvX [Candidatus Acidiferrales bacterium]
MAIPLRVPRLLPASGTTGVVLAIDYGRSRLGLALSDEAGVTARPFAVWTRTNRRRDLARLRELVRQQKVRRIVIGLPLHLGGTPSEMSEEAIRFSERLEKALGIPVELMDERLSSWEAKQTISAGASRKRGGRGTSGRGAASRSAPLDDIAAAIILRDFLDRERLRAGSRD